MDSVHGGPGRDATREVERDRPRFWFGVCFVFGTEPQGMPTGAGRVAQVVRARP